MSDLDDSAYYRRREQESLDLAARASDDGIRKIHLQMAERYAELALEVQQRPMLSIVKGTSETG